MGTGFRVLLVSICICICFFYFDAAYFATWPFGGWGRDEIGQFGDAWGALTSVFSVLAFFGVLFSLKAQRESALQADRMMEKQIRSLALQNFESNLFRMLGLLQSLIQDMDIKNKKKGIVLYSGRDVFRYFYKLKLTSNYKLMHSSEIRGEEDIKDCIKAAFQRLFNARQQDLGHYLRFVYNIFRYIHSSDIDEVHKKTYSKIVRSQLSNYELLIIYYNCFSAYGGNFKFFAIEYQLFDNLPIEELLIPYHQLLIDQKAFGENPEFDPEYARMTQ